MEESSQEVTEAVEESALIRVGLVIEIPMRTRAGNDEDFTRQIAENPDVTEALSMLLSSALMYRDSKQSRAHHAIKYSRLVLFYDDTTEAPVQMGWSEL